MWRSSKASCARAWSTTGWANMDTSSSTNAITCPRIASSRCSAGQRPDTSLGLSATVTRKDGHHPIIFMQCGPVRHRVDATAQAAARPFEHTVLVRPTGVSSPCEQGNADARIQISATLRRARLQDEARNRLICDDVIRAVREGRSPLVLTERNEHLDRLAAAMSSVIRNLIVLRGGMERKARQAVRARLAEIPEMRSAYSWRPGGISAKDSTMRGWIRCF